MNIIGTTNINHSIRTALAISVQAYCLMDFYSIWYSKNTKQPDITDVYSWLGINHAPTIDHLLELLMTAGLCNNVGTPTDKWKSQFGSQDHLEELWKILTKGNKADARKRLPKVLKKISFKDLKDKLTAYVGACDRTGTIKKGLGVWLNADKAHWDDPLPEVMPQFKNNQPQQISHGFFNG